MSDPAHVAAGYTPDSAWRNRAEFLPGHDVTVAFLTRWQHEQDDALRKCLWAFNGDRIAVRFHFESHDESGTWFGPRPSAEHDHTHPLQ